MNEHANDVPWLAEQYERGRSLESIASEVGMARLSVRRRLVKAGVPIRTSAELLRGRAKTVETKVRMAAAREAFWKNHTNRTEFRKRVSETKRGGRPRLTRGGYRMVLDLRKTRGEIREHRLVMEQALDRALSRDEIVHHRDGDPLNNTLENLELWLHGHPPGQRIKDKLTWARELLSRYGDLPEELL